MNGHVIAGTPIAVDFWNVRSCPPNVCLFFLSHLHADHTHGLKSTWRFPIYTSPVNAKLLHHFIQVKPELVKALEVGRAHLIHVQESRGVETVTVTLFDAHHCPGSVMFLFQGRFGNILYTGDFRYEHDVLEGFSPLVCGVVDVLYVDNTYCSPQHRHPPRRRAADVIVRLIGSVPETRVAIGMRNLGKEELLVRVSLELLEPIAVGQDTYKKMQLLETPDVFTTDERAARVRAVPFRRCYSKIDGGTSSIVILPTALNWGSKAKDYERRGNLYIVPYSDHSTFDELQQFVAKIRPRRVVPIVGASENCVDMSVFDSLLTRSPAPMLSLTPPARKRVPVHRPSTGRRVVRSKRPSLALLPKGVAFIDLESPPCHEYSPLSEDGAERDGSQAEGVPLGFSDVERYRETSSEDELDDGTPRRVEVPKAVRTALMSAAGTDERLVGEMDLGTTFPSASPASGTPVSQGRDGSKGNHTSLPATHKLEEGPSPAEDDDGDCRCLLIRKLDAAIVEALRRGGEQLDPVIIPTTHDCPYKKN